MIWLNGRLTGGWLVTVFPHQSRSINSAPKNHSTRGVEWFPLQLECDQVSCHSLRRILVSNNEDLIEAC